MNTANVAPTSAGAPRPKCEVCGEDADFQFFDAANPAAPKWRLFCSQHGLDYLGKTPQLENSDA